MDEEHLRELFATLPSISIRRFFGGQGIYSDGTIVAVVIDGELHLKSDPATEQVYEAAGCRRWRYSREGRSPVAMPYYRVPDEALEDPDAMAGWAECAALSASHAQARKRPARTARNPSRAR